ncbi:MAG: EamA family transporter RarD [Pseudomonadota bacterium]
MSQATANAEAAHAELKLGLLCGVIAYALWGLFPLYLKQLAPATPTEIVAQRILWSVPFGAFILSLRGQWRETLAAVKSPRVVALLALAAVFIAGNWLVYVWAVANDRVLQASLGYYINPLIFIATGVVVLKEKLSHPQIAAVALAAIGVSVLTFGAGVFPWPSFVLAFSFTAYGYVRKTTPVGAMPGLFIETALLSPFALLFLMNLQSQGTLALGHHSLELDILLFLAGPATVVPLVLFALAARRLSLTVIGFLQYIGPTGQFFLGLYYGEKFTLAHAICFGLIWTALALISIDAIRRNRKPMPTREA